MHSICDINMQYIVMFIWKFPDMCPSFKTMFLCLQVMATVQKAIENLARGAVFVEQARIDETIYSHEETSYRNTLRGRREPGHLLAHVWNAEVSRRQRALGEQWRHARHHEHPDTRHHDALEPARARLHHTARSSEDPVQGQRRLLDAERARGAASDK